MPDKNTHLNQASQNEKMAHSLKNGEHKDWAVTAIFYSALHHIEAYFAHVRDFHFTAHQRRNNAMINESNFGPIYEDYRTLQVASEKTRYSCKSYTIEQIDKDLFPLLTKIKAHVAGFLK